jgi:hypothetical protein
MSGRRVVGYRSRIATAAGDAAAAAGFPAEL